MKDAVKLTGMRVVSNIALPATILFGCLTVASAKPLSGLAEYKASWEVGWTEEWRLVEAKEKQVEHFTPGYILTWERHKDGMRWVRMDAFTTYWNLAWAHEERYEGDKLIARGPVIITSDGTPLFRMVVYLGKTCPENPIEVEILYYELELLESHLRGCHYRSSTNFNVAAAGAFRGLAGIPKDTKKVAGEDCPTVKELRSNPYKERLPAS
jgi:hypothetical protein